MTDNIRYVAPDGKVYEMQDSEWVWLQDEDVSEEMQENLNLLRTHNKTIMLKASLLDENYAVIDTLQGKIVGAPSYEMSGDSNIRRTCSITMSIPQKEQINLDFENTWKKRMVELSCGIYSINKKDYVWYRLGRMLMTDGSTVFDSTTQEVRLNLVDLIASMTSDRGSQLGSSLKFPAGTSIKNSLEAVVTAYSDFKNNNVCEFEDVMPYDVITRVKDYPIDAINDIIALFPYYEYFYDANGTFVVRQIPTKISDPIDFSKDILDDLLISEERKIDFSKIKNTVELWGNSLSGDYLAMDCTTVDNCYHVTISETFDTLIDGETYTVMPVTDSVLGQTMQIQDLEEYQLYTSDGAELVYQPLAAGAMKANTAYVVKYFQEKFILQGELQVRVIVQEITEEPTAAMKEEFMAANGCDNVKWVVNPDSPFACTISNGFIRGETRVVLEGGEYSGIYTTQLALERANYELWLRCRMQDSIEVEMILIPWMELFDKIEFTSPSKGDVGVWLVQDIDYNFNNWTMTVKANRFYPYYPW